MTGLLTGYLTFTVMGVGKMKMTIVKLKFFNVIV